MKKIAVIGCAGSGKTTLALKLSRLLSLPIVHLDQYYWKPGWTCPVLEDFVAMHKALCDEEKWIIDGISSKTLEYRMQKADCIIFLDTPITVCLWRVIKRAFKFWGKIRSDSQIGCPERLSFEFLWWIFNFPYNSRPTIVHLIDKYQSTKLIYIIRSEKEQKRILSQLKQERVIKD